MDQSDSIMTNRFIKPDMMFYEDRLHTFEYWSKQIRPNKEALTKAGFYYTGTADKVTCFACGVNLSSWEPDDEPWAEHETWSPACIYLKMTGYKTEDKNLMQPGVTFQTEKQSKLGFAPAFGQNSGHTFGFGTNSITGANLFVKR
jgi:hypothetical protein